MVANFGMEQFWFLPINY